MVRIRNIYDSNINKYFPIEQGNKIPENIMEDIEQKIKAKKVKPGFNDLINFLKEVYQILSLEFKPEVEFEVIYPVLEILKYMNMMFGHQEY